MRTISFDESLVMREYARIAGEKNFVKTAADQMPAVPTPIPLGERQERPVGAPMEKWTELLNASKVVDDLEKKRLLEGINIPTAIRDFAKFNAVIEKIKLGDPNLYAALAPKLQEAMAKRSSTKTDLVVEATEGYDVSGETGKDLVDSAHPGKMHTEVTYHKDDEGNLIETILEQQETDIDVAHSVPKGTYATLMDLYEKLNKMGHTDVLKDLEHAIKLVATPEEVFNYTLITLANKLDDGGFVEVANKVDTLIKKALESDTYPGNMYMPYDPVQQTRNDISQQSRMPGTGNWPPLTTPAAAAPVIQQPTKPVQNANKSNPKVLQFQQSYNKTKGALKEDGIWGPNTEAAWKSSQPKQPELEPIPQTTTPPAAPPEAPPAPLKPEQYRPVVNPENRFAPAFSPAAPKIK
ncbi:MAG: hypothetical protein WC523_00710 [Patescibacteria group bacterium]